ncbi:MAG: DsrE family protein [Vicinamibacteria bacterium]|nr:DsrE family protein [Vicinamibacteria bacterium]
MRIGVIIATNDVETAFNALRFANFAVAQQDVVKVFLLGKGVELDRTDDLKFDVRQQARTLIEAGGEILACGACLKLRASGGSELCPLSTMKDLYELVRDSDRVVSF